MNSIIGGATLNNFRWEYSAKYSCRCMPWLESQPTPEARDILNYATRVFQDFNQLNTANPNLAGPQSFTARTLPKYTPPKAGMAKLTQAEKDSIIQPIRLSQEALPHLPRQSDRQNLWYPTEENGNQVFVFNSAVKLPPENWPWQELQDTRIPPPDTPSGTALQECHRRQIPSKHNFQHLLECWDSCLKVTWFHVKVDENSNNRSRSTNHYNWYIYSPRKN
jgi:hypothetical protein